MSKIYVVDYGIEKLDSESLGCDDIRNKVKNKIETTWNPTGFDTTYWKNVEGECNVQETKDELEKSIKTVVGENCKVSLLLMCVDKCNIVGTQNGEVVFGTEFIAQKRKRSSFFTS